MSVAWASRPSNRPDLRSPRGAETSSSGVIRRRGNKGYAPHNSLISCLDLTGRTKMYGWPDEKEYPFEHHYLELPMGGLHYVDEGEGDRVLVMVHGDPAWSFLYRHLIKGLSSKYRCIAMDHIGFGLSDKPEDWSYLPKAHAENLEALIGHLNLTNFVMVVQDWGGPIGLSYVLKYPDKVTSLVIMNTGCGRRKVIRISRNSAVSWAAP